MTVVKVEDLERFIRMFSVMPPEDSDIPRDWAAGRVSALKDLELFIEHHRVETNDPNV